MNLVAKEYVAARIDHGGALVLSEFAGAATELRQAFLCNPHDPDDVKDALLRAIRRRPRGRDGGGCRSCSGICARTTSTAGPGRSSPTWPRREIDA